MADELPATPPESPLPSASAPAPPPPSKPRPGFWKRHRGTILTILLALYAIGLGIAVADDVFHLGLFPTDLEREVRDLIRKLDGPEEAARREAADKLVRDGDAFVVVPALIRVLDSPSDQTRSLAADCLRRIAGTTNDYDPAAPAAARRAAIARWRQWWRENDRRF